MNYKKLLVDSGNEMIKRKLTVETWGNISVRDPDSGLIYLTPSAMPYDVIKEEDIGVVDADGNIVEGIRKPTIEIGMHVAIMQKRKDVNAIVHTHPFFSQVFACLHEPIPPIIDEAAQAFGGEVRCAEYAIPGTPELANNVVKALGKGYGALLANHGALCVGNTMEVAFKRCTVLEMTAKIYQMASAIGKPYVEDDDVVAITHNFANNHYGQDK